MKNGNIDDLRRVVQDVQRQQNRMVEAVWRAIVGNDTPKKEDGELIIQGQGSPVTVYHFMYKGEEAATMTIKEVFPGRFSYFIQQGSIKLLDVMEKIKEVAMEEYGEEDKIWLPTLNENGCARNEANL